MIGDYQKYELNWNEKCIYYGGTLVMCLTLGILFFDSYLVGLIVFPISYVAKPFAERYMAERRLRKLRLEFVDFLYSISASVSAGMHMGDALEEARNMLRITENKTEKKLKVGRLGKNVQVGGSAKNLQVGDSAKNLQLGNSNSLLVEELDGMLAKMRSSNDNEKTLLYDFAKRTGLDDLKNFVEGYYACRDSGGDLVGTVNRSTQVITDKLLIEKDMKTLVSQKVFEGRLIALLPPGIILVLRLMSPEYLYPLYNTGFGRVIMCGSLGAMAFAFYYAQRLQKVVFKETIESGLPEFMSRLSMLLGSGMVLQTALEKIGTEETKTSNLLLCDFRKVYEDANRENLPVLRKFHDYAMRMGSRELIRFCGIMSANTDKGTELVSKLENESEFMWHSAKKQIEEKSKLAETKMTFPMSIMLIVLILITTAPALMGL